VSKRSLRIYLLDIMEEIERIEKFFSSIKSEEDLKTNDVVFYATLKALENIGEAIKHIPNEIREMYPEIPWKQIVALRNILVHEYFGISYSIIYDIAINELPLLKNAIIQIQEEVNER